MSQENTPTDNVVGKRFMRTFKQHEIDEKTIEQAIQEVFITNLVTQSKNKKYTSIITIYVKKLNKKSDKKSTLKSPENHDKDVSTASIFIQDLFTLKHSQNILVQTNDVLKLRNTNMKILK